MKFTCSSCNQTLEADQDMAGTYVECPACKKRLRIPEIEQQTGKTNQISWVPALVFQSIQVVSVVLLTLLLLGNAFEGEFEEAAVVMVIFFFAPVILCVIFSMILHYKCWQALPSQFARTTPGKAVGMLFVPFYNFYWVFPSVVGLAQDYRAWAAKTGTSGVKNYYGIGLALSVLFICQWVLIWIPILGGLLALASFVLWILFYMEIVKYANLPK